MNRYVSVRTRLNVVVVIVFVLCGWMGLMGGGLSAQDEMDGAAAAFDFWVGKWDLSWKTKDGTLETGSNNIKKILGNKILRENFEALTGSMKGFRGKSWSAYNGATGEWHQTWVDTNGAYLDFVGEIAGDKRIFKRSVTARDGKVHLQRMVFSNISDKALDWNWEASIDNGKSWQLKWHIHYQRAKPKADKDKSKKKDKKKKKKKDKVKQDDE